MQRHALSPLPSSISMLLAVAALYAGEPQPMDYREIADSGELQRIVEEARDTALQKFRPAGLKEEQLAITLIDLRDPDRPRRGSVRGDVPIYPASVVKLFYLAAAQQWLEDGKVEKTEELDRALRDMIAVSSNDATSYVVDVLTDTTSGKELPDEEMAAWQERRNAMNRYFASLGYAGINANQKTFCEDAYGRERVSRGPRGENRNKLTTDATARLLAETATGRIVTPPRCREMLDLLQRDLARKAAGSDDQSLGFTGGALQGIDGARLWSKAGWTSTTRHDAAYIELPDARRFVLVTFTSEHSRDREIIPTVAEVAVRRMRNSVE